MRKRFVGLEEAVELPVIHGVSAFVPRLCFYSYTRNNRDVVPPCIPADAEYINDSAPAAQWNFDILSDEGMANMTQIADEVEAMVAQHAW